MPRRIGAALIAIVFVGVFTQSQIGTLPAPSVNMTPRQVVLLLFGAYFLCYCVMLAFRFINPKGHSANKPTAIDEMLRRRVCPSCGGDMLKAPITEDLRATCPRCRAVWRMPLILETLRDRARQTPDGVDEPGGIGD